MGEKTDIKSMMPEEIDLWLKESGVKSYKGAYQARSIFSWLSKGVESFDEMTDISKDLRSILKEKSIISLPFIKKRLVSDIDSTVKYLYGLFDDESIETVLMSYHHGDSLCLSTQVGCRMGCGFCASTLGGLKRNLTPAEMLDQIIASEKDSGRKVSSIVLMGIGEPLDNYDNVLKFLKILSCKEGLNMSLRHVSLSTCGVVDKIYELKKERLGLTLSISLHAPNDEIRSKIMPINKKWNVDSLLAACLEYADDTSRRISFEYAMLSGVNDSDACARELGSKLRGMLCHVNLIPVNEVRESEYKKPPNDRIKRFAAILSDYGLTVTVRRTLGSDINASCGQLRRSQNGAEGGS